jgi:hypothetical protein
MNCPSCEARTRVIAKRGPFRDRICANPGCRRHFTTRENPLDPTAPTAITLLRKAQPGNGHAKEHAA